MKVLFCIDCLSPGGKERRFVELLKGLKASTDIEFEIIIMNKDVHYKEIWDLGSKIYFVIRKQKKDLSVFRKIYNISKKFRPDIIHCFDSMTAVYVIPTCLLLRTKLINGLICDAPERLEFKYWFRSKLTFPFSKAIVGNSYAGLTAYNAPVKKSTVIHNGYNFKRLEHIQQVDEIRQELGITTPLVVGMVASFSKYKDYRTFFNAAQFLLSTRNDITFLAIGRDTDSDEARSLIENRFSDKIKTIGKRSNIESYINVMDICVLATFTEGISNAVMEYMALSKPVIATNGGGTKEIIDEGKTGFLVNASNEKELAEKMNLLLDDFMLRSKMGKNGKKRILKNFSIEYMVDQYLAVYTTCSQKKLNKNPGFLDLSKKTYSESLN